jgi:hypothetical protein
MLDTVARHLGITGDCYGQPLGVHCLACERRVLVPLDRIGAHKGDMKLLHRRR